jgi:hypothetical protein
MANYYISGVWKNSEKVITHVALHLVNANTFNRATKTTEAEAIALIQNGHKMNTVTWSYLHASWKIGAEVLIVHEGGKKYLRTKGDSTVRDNLDNLIDMWAYMG